MALSGWGSRKETCCCIERDIKTHVKNVNERCMNVSKHVSKNNDVVCHMKLLKLETITPAFIDIKSIVYTTM